MKMNKKRILGVSFNFAYNILASFLIIGATTFVLNPKLATYYTTAEYGTILSICSVISVFSNGFGNTLNNVRLIQNNVDNEEELSLNYLPLITITGLFSSVATLGLSIFYFKQDLLISLLLFFYCALVTFKAFYIVAFRVKLDFKKNLFMSLLVALIYVLGGIFIQYIYFWPIIYIFAEIVSIFFVKFFCKTQRYYFSFSSNIKNILKKYFVLILCSIATNIILYLDRIIIHPFLGADSVAIYNVASLFGKCLGMVMSPVANVLLGYYAQKGSSNFTLKKFWTINICVVSATFIFIFFIPIISPFFTELLYPKIYESAYPYLFVCNLTAAVSVMPVLTMPAIIKFCGTRYELCITAIYGSLYIILSSILMRSDGLIGFCVASLIANVVKLLLMYIIGSSVLHRRIRVEKNV